ncbi:MAG: glycosyltransferase family 2 protein [Deltaproteobacteria bacterium]|nr:glycosyltransferase family 2 protein [Deltaproteobacteria bacterium]
MQMAVDPEVRLLVPADDCPEPEISIVVPALNEALTIGDFIDWCQQGLREAGVQGEILIIDSSSDNTAEIAIGKGARVLRTPKRGLGRAYIDSKPFIRGKFLILGDCDCTYDFRELKPFVDAYRKGYEYVMGSRFKGRIDEGAMPPLHRYFGTPVTTWILNRIFRSKFSDIHCGMRGISRDAFMRLNLQSQSWEYASEMVIKSVHLDLRTTEVPIHFLKDREGRLSHHRRSGWFSPWHAGWINLKAMFTYGADYFLYRPGWLLLLAGLACVLPLLGGPLDLGRVTLSLNWMLFGLTLATLGLQCVYTGVVAQVLYDPTGRVLSRWIQRYAYDRAVIGSGLLFVAGVALCVPFVLEYVQGNFRLDAGVTGANYLAVGGLLAIVSGFMSFTFTLVLHALAASRRSIA